MKNFERLENPIIIQIQVDHTIFVPFVPYHVLHKVPLVGRSFTESRAALEDGLLGYFILCFDMLTFLKLLCNWKRFYKTSTCIQLKYFLYAIFLPKYFCYLLCSVVSNIDVEQQKLMFRIEIFSSLNV